MIQVILWFSYISESRETQTVNSLFNSNLTQQLTGIRAAGVALSAVLALVSVVVVVISEGRRRISA